MKDDSFTYLMFIISDSSSFHTKRKEISKQTAQHEGYQEMSSLTTDSSRSRAFYETEELYLEKISNGEPNNCIPSLEYILVKLHPKPII